MLIEEHIVYMSTFITTDKSIWQEVLAYSERDVRNIALALQSCRFI